LSVARSSSELRDELDRARERLASLERDTSPDYTPGSSIPGVPDPEQLPTPEGLDEVNRLKARIDELERAYADALAADR
jgi:hypothetical protein